MADILGTTDQRHLQKASIYFGLRAMTCRSEKLRNQHFLFRKLEWRYSPAGLTVIVTAMGET
jgi:hypothetical protein